MASLVAMRFYILILSIILAVLAPLASGADSYSGITAVEDETAGDELATVLSRRGLLVRCVGNCSRGRRRGQRRGRSPSRGGGAGRRGPGRRRPKSKKGGKKKKSTNKKRRPSNKPKGGKGKKSMKPSGGMASGGSKGRSGGGSEPILTPPSSATPAPVASGGSSGGSGGSGGPAPSGGAKDGGGKYIVCLPATLNEGSYHRFGKGFKFKGKPDGIRVWPDGKCQLEEWAGGFDGFWSVNAGDTHEEELAEATRQMLRSGNAKATEFLTALMKVTKPIDLDHPKDEGRANGGIRMDNINRASRFCTQMIDVQRC